MNDFEHRLGTLLSERADRTVVSVDIDSVKRRHPSQPTRASTTRVSGNGWLVAAVVTAVVVGGLVVLASRRSADPASRRSDRPEVSDDGRPGAYGELPQSGPAIDDHWHIAYGIDVCGTWLELQGDLEERSADETLTNDSYAATGIHSHDDGLIHIHPFGQAGVGTNARLGVFFDNYNTELSDDELRFPPDQADGAQLTETQSRCGDQLAELVVIVWPDPSAPDNKIVITEGLAGTPLSVDGMAIAVAFTNDPDSVGMPPSVATSTYHEMFADAQELLDNLAELDAGVSVTTTIP